MFRLKILETFVGPHVFYCQNCSLAVSFPLWAEWLAMTPSESPTACRHIKWIIAMQSPFSVQQEGCEPLFAPMAFIGMEISCKSRHRLQIELQNQWMVGWWWWWWATVDDHFPHFVLFSSWAVLYSQLRRQTVFDEGQCGLGANWLRVRQCRWQWSFMSIIMFFSNMCYIHWHLLSVSCILPDPVKWGLNQKRMIWSAVLSVTLLPSWT